MANVPKCRGHVKINVSKLIIKRVYKLNVKLIVKILNNVRHFKSKT